MYVPVARARYCQVVVPEATSVPVPRGFQPVVGAAIIAGLVRLLCLVTRHRVVTPERVSPLIAEAPVILLFWHHHLFMQAMLIPPLLIRRGLSTTVLISRSRDGDLGHRLGIGYGTSVVRGSSSRGGGSALRQLLRMVTVERSSPIIIGDGPRGPARVLKGGTVALSRLAGLPIVPLACAADRSWRLRSWDRLVVPKPGARIGFAIGAPWTAPRRLDEAGTAATLVELANSLDSLEREAVAAVSPGADSDRGVD